MTYALCNICDNNKPADLTTVHKDDFVCDHCLEKKRYEDDLTELFDALDNETNEDMRSDIKSSINKVKQLISEMK